MLEGQCQCGAVRYRASGEITELSHCHCSICRRLHGAAFVSFAGVRRAGFSWTGGADLLRTYASSAGTDRLSCSRCGSQLGCILKSDPEHVYLALGGADGDPPGLPRAFHQYVASGVTWFDPGDGLPQFPHEYTEDA